MSRLRATYKMAEWHIADLRVTLLSLAISNSLIAFTVCVALAWGMVVFIASPRSVRVDNVDRIVAALLGISSLTWLLASVANIWGAHWLRRIADVKQRAGGQHHAQATAFSPPGTQ